MARIMSVFGTRPEAIKMAPLVKELEKDGQFESLVCVTGQHREMLDSVLDVFGIIPDHDLNIMKQKQTLDYITSSIIEKLSQVLEQSRPDLILVHGDTTTSFAAALAGFYQKIPVGHVEAGLRSFDRYSPFPEEMNRMLTGRLASLHFAPTEANRQNLLSENVTGDIYVTGNTVIDAMGYTVRENYSFEDRTLKALNFEGRRTILLTAHRRENLGDPLKNICRALKQTALAFDDVQVVFPVHKNPAVRQVVTDELGGLPSVHLIEPISVFDMHNLIAHSHLVLTDSGGLQEEAPALGKPVLVLRTETERPEVVECGGAMLVGVECGDISSAASRLLTDGVLYKSMQSAKNPYGDGTASQKIAGHIKQWLEDRR